MRSTGFYFAVVGILIFVFVMTASGWDFSELNPIKYETNMYEINEDFSGLSINTGTADIAFVLSGSENCRVECYEAKKARHLVSVEEDTLIIRIQDELSWYERIGINFSSPRITLHLPKAAYSALGINGSTGDILIPEDISFETMDISISTGDINSRASASGGIRIETSTGDIQLENMTADMLDLSVSTGDIHIIGADCTGDIKLRVTTGKAILSDTRCKNLLSEGSTGDLSLKNVIAEEKFCIERSTGDIELDGCDAGEILIETDTGNVSGTLLSEKIFFAERDTGRVSVPHSLNGGRCEITSDTGSIRIEIP